ncbi:hypothetical protein HRI_002588000 [Hibiscus trionum]|uniref:Uncharacterized protein n=1 Tax=Hibiscus trionum TaxID=183268 RepID=A0A9W7I555_HIBTR|nr:hypothetical protein HRI_002588000 [Hibiscus trionum]
MKPSCLAVSLLVFLIFLSSVEGIRLEESFKSTVHVSALMNNSYGVKGDFIICKQGHCTGTKKKKSHHWMPSIHEDYRGPRRHRPKHH